MNILLVLADQSIDFNKKSLFIIFLTLYIVLVAIITRMGSKRAIGSLKAFLLSTFLTPVVGFFIVSISQVSQRSTHHKKSSASSHRKKRLHKCRHCGYKFKGHIDVCPLCGKARDIKS